MGFQKQALPNTSNISSIQTDPNDRTILHIILDLLLCLSMSLSCLTGTKDGHVKIPRRAITFDSSPSSFFFRHNQSMFDIQPTAGDIAFNTMNERPRGPEVLPNMCRINGHIFNSYFIQSTLN